MKLLFRIAVLILVAVNNYGLSQNIETIIQDGLIEGSCKNYKTFVDSINQCTVIIRLDEKEKVNMVGLFPSMKADSICEELSTENYIEGSYFFIKNKKVMRFISERSTNYFIVIDKMNRNEYYSFLKGKNQIYGLTLEAKKGRLKKLFIGSTN